MALGVLINKRDKLLDHETTLDSWVTILWSVLWSRDISSIEPLENFWCKPALRLHHVISNEKRIGI